MWTWRSSGGKWHPGGSRLAPSQTPSQPHSHLRLPWNPALSPQASSYHSSFSSRNWFPRLCAGEHRLWRLPPPRPCNQRRDRRVTSPPGPRESSPCRHFLHHLLSFIYFLIRPAVHQKAERERDRRGCGGGDRLLGLMSAHMSERPVLNPQFKSRRKFRPEMQSRPKKRRRRINRRSFSLVARCWPDKSPFGLFVHIKDVTIHQESIRIDLQVKENYLM